MFGNSLEERVARLEEKVRASNAIDEYYLALIKDYAESEAEKAVAKILEKPIEMTIEDIEKAFNHKVKIVNSKE